MLVAQFCSCNFIKKYSMTKDARTLDRILTYLKLSERPNNKLLNQILVELNIIASDEEVDYYESKLIEEGVVTPLKMSHDRLLLRITPGGIVFITEGGFTRNKIWSTIQDIKELIGLARVV